MRLGEFLYMDPRHAIAPTVLVRRAGKKKWHLAKVRRGHVPGRDRLGDGGYVSTRCGQAFRLWNRAEDSKTAYNAAEVDCNDCLVAAISEGRP